MERIPPPVLPLRSLGRHELKDIQADEPSLPIRYWCQDETRIGLKTRLGRRLTSSGGPIAEVQWPRKAIWLYGIMSPATGECFFFEYSHLDQICFEDFLQRIAQVFPQSLNVIQWDGAPVHIARDLEIPDNIVLLFQPPHSLELNSIERLWLDLKIDLRGMMFSNFDELQINDESDSRIDDTRMDCFIDESSFHIEDSI